MCKPRQCSTCDWYEPHRENGLAKHSQGCCRINGAETKDDYGCNFYQEKGDVENKCSNCKNYKPSLSAVIGTCMYLNVNVNPDWTCGDIFTPAENSN